MKKGLGKRAQTHSMLWVLMEIALVLTVFISFSVKLSDIKNDILFDKIYLAKEVGLMTTSIYGAPGDVNYIYTGRINNFSASFEGGKATIFFKEPVNGISFPYVSDSNLEQSVAYTHLNLINNSDISFKKSSNTLSISGGEIKFVSDRLGCAEALNKNFRKEKEGVVLDPSYQGSFPGMVIEQNREANVTWILANAVKSQLIPDPVFMTRNDNVEVSETTRLSITQDKAFTVSFVLTEEDKVNIQIKDDSLKNKKFACLLINEFSEMDELDKGDITITEKSFIKNSKSDVSVMVEVSKDFPYNNLEKRKEFALKVKNAVGEYYG